jgi:hypothetical protein
VPEIVYYGENLAATDYCIVEVLMGLTATRLRGSSVNAFEDF